MPIDLISELHVLVRIRTGQLGRVVKAMDLKSIGETRVSSNLTAVDTFRASRHLGREKLSIFCTHQSKAKQNMCDENTH
jgi:hypothetical protein